MTADELQVWQHGNFDVAVCLFGGFAFNIMWGYCLHHPDPDMRIISWQLLSKTLCTLIGVMIETSFADAVTWYFAPQGNAQILVVFGICFVSWYFLMHVQMFCAKYNTADVNHYKFKMEFWAPIISFVGGNSCKKVWSTLQPYLFSTAVATFESTSYELGVLCYFGAWALFHPVMKVLHWIARTARKKCAELDGSTDEYEAAWISKIQGCEDNIDMMSLSFIFVQACRFQITGAAPAVTGADPAGFMATSYEIKALFGLSVVIMVMFLVVNSLPKTFAGNDTIIATHARFSGRLKLCLKNILAWCWYFGGLWLITPWFGTRVIGTILQALLTTVLVFVIIHILDKIRDIDNQNTDGGIVSHTLHIEKIHMEHHLIPFIQPFSLLIAWSWKSAFTASLKEISKRTATVLSVEVETWILTVCFIILILPAWRWFVLPRLYGHLLPAHLQSPAAEAREVPEKTTPNDARGYVLLRSA